VTFTEITDRKRREREVNAAKEFAEAIVEAVRFPLVVLTPELHVESANAAFYETFQITPRRVGGQASGAAGQPAVGHPGTASAPVDSSARADGVLRFRD
jgi:PAS domain-containing protein